MSATILHPLRAKLIFNPNSGIPAEAPARLLAILTEMQNWSILPEVCLLGPGINLPEVIEEALRSGIRLIVASGGDGTINSVASLLSGTNAVLGIIPGGTQNNVALSLGLPRDIPAAVAMLRSVSTAQVDMGAAACRAEGDFTGTNGAAEKRERLFLEICAVGLVSALFPAADEIQRGNLARLGDFLATLVSFPPASMNLLLDGHDRLDLAGHVVLIGNMPYAGPNFPVSQDVPPPAAWLSVSEGKNQAAPKYSDGLLDVLVFSSLSKLDLIGAALQTASGGVEDPRIQRFQVREIEIEADPPMPVMADGFPLGSTPLRVHIKRGALTILVPAAR